MVFKTLFKRRYLMKGLFLFLLEFPPPLGEVGRGSLIPQSPEGEVEDVGVSFFTMNYEL